MDEQPFATPLGPTPSGFGATPTTQPPEGHLFTTSSTAETKPVKVDHLTEIAELARRLHNVSPSGAETVSAKILEHIAALQEGK